MPEMSDVGPWRPMTADYVHSYDVSEEVAADNRQNLLELLAQPNHMREMLAMAANCVKRAVEALERDDAIEGGKAYCHDSTLSPLEVNPGELHRYSELCPRIS